MTWIFNTPAYESRNWRTLEQAKHPEDAIGLTSVGMEQMLADSGMKQVNYFPGNWKEIPGLYFQDVLVFEKI
ncbi:MAG: hypothetical protein U5L96_12745 [Owenweeksia sp.]|nr:hypothetical protein [Owenweeksia sp.]